MQVDTYYRHSWVLSHELTPVWGEEFLNANIGIGKKYGPVETEQDDCQEDGHNNFVDWLNGWHTTYHRQWG